MLVEVLAAQSRSARARASAPADLAPVQSLLDGIGEPVALTLPAQSGSVGRTLAELELRGATGATCLAIVRGEQGVISPSAGERLQAGDVLALAGTHEAIAAARQLLLAEAPSPRDRATPSDGA
jgi:CPA2 family monovalent cation:H+ antiporter-2